MKRNIEFLEGIMNWIGNNCDIIPCKAALGIKRDRKQELDKLIGRLFVDTVLIASSPGYILFSDDERLRSFAKGEFNVEGVWTQALLIHCVNGKSLEKSEYCRMVMGLVKLHYYYVSIDTDVLVEAARQSNWFPSEEFRLVLNVLGGRFSDENSGLGVGASFLYELWKQPILPQYRDQIVFNLLDAITDRRTIRFTLDKFIAIIKQRFNLLPLAVREIIRLSEIWKQTRII